MKRVETHIIQPLDSIAVYFVTPENRVYIAYLPQPKHTHSRIHIKSFINDPRLKSKKMSEIQEIYQEIRAAYYLSCIHYCAPAFTRVLSCDRNPTAGRISITYPLLQKINIRALNNHQTMYSFLVQILHSLFCAQSALAFVHHDLHLSNIMETRDKSTKQYNRYIHIEKGVPTYDIVIPKAASKGRVYKIIDLGRARFEFNGYVSHWKGQRKLSGISREFHSTWDSRQLACHLLLVASSRLKIHHVFEKILIKLSGLEEWRDEKNNLVLDVLGTQRLLKEAKSNPDFYKSKKFIAIRCQWIHCKQEVTYTIRDALRDLSSMEEFNAQRISASKLMDTFCFEKEMFCIKMKRIKSNTDPERCLVCSTWTKKKCGSCKIIPVCSKRCSDHAYDCNMHRCIKK